MSAWTKFRGTLRAFGGARGGNVAITFGLASIPIICATGAAIDYSRANSVKADMQAALDSTALILSKEAATDTNTELQQDASKYFQADFNRSEAKNITVTASYSSSDSSVTVHATVNVPTTIMQIVDYNQFTIEGSSTATWGVQDLRVALVLDNTGSMADSGKIGALKTASKSLLSILQSSSQTPGDVQVAIIPFANGVNVDTSNIGATWLDWSYYSNSGGGGWGGGGWGGSGGWGSGGYYGFNNSGYGSHGRGYGGKGSGYYNGGYSSWGGNYYGGGGSSSGSCGWSSCWQSSNSSWSTSPASTNTSHWQGCVMDRDQDNDVENTTPTQSDKSTLFPAIYSTSCPVALMPLSYDWSALSQKIDSMSPNGSTNQTIGLVWGWQALSQGDPLNAPALTAHSQQAIVMRPDGLNTENRWSTDQATIDARTEKVCDNIKNAGITIYTVQVDTGGDPTSTLLQNCASDQDKFFLLTDSDQIVSTFNDIATQLAKLRIAK